MRERYGRLDVHVNNAGVAPRVRLDVLETTEESYDFLMDINLKGTFFMCPGRGEPDGWISNGRVSGIIPPGS